MDLIELIQQIDELSKAFDGKFMVIPGYEQTPMCYKLLQSAPYALFYYQTENRLVQHKVDDEEKSADLLAMMFAKIRSGEATLTGKILQKKP